MLAWARFDRESGAFEQAQAWPPQIRRNAGERRHVRLGIPQPTGGRAGAEYSRGRRACRNSGEGACSPDGRMASTGTPQATIFPSCPKARFDWRTSERSRGRSRKQGPEAVMRWAEGVPNDPPRFKQAVFLKATSTLAGVDAPLTAHWLSGHLDHDYVDDALMIAAGSWVTNDGPAAMKLAHRTPPWRRSATAAVKSRLQGLVQSLATGSGKLVEIGQSRIRRRPGRTLHGGAESRRAARGLSEVGGAHRGQAVAGEAVGFALRRSVTPFWGHAPSWRSRWLRFAAARDPILGARA